MESMEISFETDGSSVVAKTSVETLYDLLSSHDLMIYEELRDYLSTQLSTMPDVKMAKFLAYCYYQIIAEVRDSHVAALLTKKGKIKLDVELVKPKESLKVLYFKKL